MASTSKTPFEGLDITSDEVQRIEKALKNEEFRKLFVEYAQEISDPENRRKYEEELAELERSRGMDVKFLHPKPGYVLKTSINGEKKAFINVCMNENLAKPKAEKNVKGSGVERKAGVSWSVPYSLAPGRDDLDHSGNKCVAYDCLFHPECFDLIEKDKRFRTLMENTAMDGIEREFGVKLDRNNVKRPKMKFKGRAQATIMRTPRQDGPSGENSLDAVNVQYPYGNSNGEKTQNGASHAANSASKISGNRNEAKDATNTNRLGGKKNGFTEPKYSIVHRGHFDMQQYTFARDAMPSTRPQELIVKVELPLLKSAATVQLDVFKKNLHLECKKPASYCLDLALPFPVDEDKGSAKFDKSKSCLSITLAVLPPEIPKVPSIPEHNNSKPLVEEITSSNDVPSDSSLRTNGSNAEDVGKEMDADLADKKVDDAENCADEVPPCVLNHSMDAGVISPSNVDPNQSYSSLEGSPTLPRYDFYQTEEGITLIIREVDIDSETLAAVVSEDGQMVKVTGRRNLESRDPAHHQEMFSIVISCMEGQTVDREVKKDVSDTNAMLMMKKKEGCGGLWSGFRAGVSAEAQEHKLFLTEASLETLLSRVIEEQPSNKETEPCRVTKFSAESVKAEFEVKTKTNADSAEIQTTQETSKAQTSLSALDLARTVDPNEESSQYSDSQPSPPSSDTSRPSGLKSALRSPRRRAYKSVSFSEEVLVELFLEGPTRIAKKKKGGRRSPYFGPRRTIEKLKDNSWESYSDSELLHGHGGGSTEEDDDHEGSGWDWRPDQVLMRQSSSENDSGPEIPFSKGKSKSKGSRRRRKEKARREANLANKVQDFSDTIDYISDPQLSGSRKPVAKQQGESTEKQSNERNQDVNDNLSSGSDSCKDVNDATNNNNDQEKAMDEGNNELPLEMQDHSTKCAFEFSNQVIFDLDD